MRTSWVQLSSLTYTLSFTLMYKSVQYWWLEHSHTSTKQGNDIHTSWSKVFICQFTVCAMLGWYDADTMTTFWSGSLRLFSHTCRWLSCPSPSLPFQSRHRCPVPGSRSGSGGHSLGRWGCPAQLALTVETMSKRHVAGTSDFGLPTRLRRRFDLPPREVPGTWTVWRVSHRSNARTTKQVHPGGR